MAVEPDKMFKLSKVSRDLLMDYAKKAHGLFLSTWNIRNTLTEIDTYYMREGNLGYDHTESKKKNRTGDKYRYHDFTVPIVMPQVESALNYFSNVFLSGYPIFGVTGGPDVADVALQLETVFADHSRKAKWIPNLSRGFRDNLKYNLMGLCIDWDEIVSWDVKTDPLFSTTKGKPTQALWAGNFIKRMDLYNSFWDVRVLPHEVHTKGEYAGYTELMVRPVFKQFCNNMREQLQPHVVELALNSSYAASWDSAAMGQYYVPQINPDAMLTSAAQGEFNWIAWATGTDGSRHRRADIKFTNVYSVSRVYCRIIPSDYNMAVPEANTSQIWELCIVNDAVLLYAKRKTNAHNNLPTVFGQLHNDGLGYQTKSFASNVTDMQDIASAFWNMNIASKRRALMDRIFYDPLRIREADINSTNPAAKIPVRPSAYGKTIADAVHVAPYRDENADRLPMEADLIIRQSDRINGQNPAQQGQFVKGNKTKREYDDVMGHSNSRNQTMAFNLEHDTLADVKEILLLNTMQNQAQVELLNADKKQVVKIDPAQLRKAMISIKVSDGMLPSDKIMGSEDLTVALQTMQSVPAIGQEYKVGSIFAQLMSQRGVDLSPHRKSPALRMYEQQMAAWQQQATLAAEKGAPFSTPMPEPSAELQQELQAESKPNTLLSLLTAPVPNSPTAGSTPVQPAQ